MLDDLRRQAEEVEYDELGSQELPGSVENESDERFLGLTPIQRFFIALLLLVITILVGLLCLLLISILILV